jgi:DNA polymerase-3 subunit delta
LLYILWGEDAFSREEKLQDIKNNLGDLSLLSTNSSVFEGQKLHLKELKAVGEATPFLAPQRLVIIKGLLERYEPREKSARAKNGGDQKDEALQFAGIIRGFPASTLLVLIDDIASRGSPLKNNPLYQSLADKASVIQYPLLKGVKLGQWIQDRITRQGGGISRKATEILIELIGGDLYALSNEINKLVAFTAGRMIEEKDIRLVVSAAQEASIFVMIDAILVGRGDGAKIAAERGSSPPDSGDAGASNSESGADQRPEKPPEINL